MWHNLVPGKNGDHESSSVSPAVGEPLLHLHSSKVVQWLQSESEVLVHAML